MQAFQSTKQRYATLYNIIQRYLPFRLLIRLSPAITPSNPPLYSDHQTRLLKHGDKGTKGQTQNPKCKNAFVGPSTKVPKPKSNYQSTTLPTYQPTKILFQKHSALYWTTGQLDNCYFQNAQNFPIKLYILYIL